jgi:hypothetical protein
MAFGSISQVPSPSTLKKDTGGANVGALLLGEATTMQRFIDGLIVESVDSLPLLDGQNLSHNQKIFIGDRNHGGVGTVIKSPGHGIVTTIGVFVRIDDDTYFLRDDAYAKIKPEWFGVIGNDATRGAENKTGFDLMLEFIRVYGGEVSLSGKIYTITGSVDPTVNGQTKGIKWVGPGSLGCELHFASYVSGQVSGMELGFNASNMHLEGFTLRGAGAAVQNDASNNVTGLNDIANSNSPGFFGKDLAFRDWSGNGCSLVRWFQQRWVACYGRDNGGWGMVLDGDQAPYFSGASGQFFRYNGIGGLWIKKGDAFVQDLNLENENIGIRVGTDTTKRATLSVTGANLERLNPGSIGIYVAEDSQVLQCQGVTAQGPESPGGLGGHAMYFERANGFNHIFDFVPTWFSTSAGDGWEFGITVANATASAKIHLSSSRDADVPVRGGNIPLVSGARRDVATGVHANSFKDDPIDAQKGLHNQGVSKNRSVFHVQSVDGSVLDLSGGFEAPVYYVECTGGAVTVILPSGSDSDYDDSEAVFIKADNSVNAVILQTSGSQTISGVNDPVLSSQYDKKRIHIPEVGSNLFEV